MEIIDVFSENGKTLNEILEEYIIVTLQSLINNKKFTVDNILLQA
jgi:hypothetical protein